MKKAHLRSALLFLALFLHHSVILAVSFTPLGDLAGGGFSSSPSTGSISGNGNVVVGASNSSSGSEAFMWSGGSMVGLGSAPSSALGVSYDGSVMVGFTGYRFTSNHAFKYTNSDGMVGLDLLPSKTGSSASNISGDGSVIIGSSCYTSQSTCQAVYWNDSGDVFSLGGLSGSLSTSNSEAFGVSSDGQVISGWVEV